MFGKKVFALALLAPLAAAACGRFGYPSGDDSAELSSYDFNILKPDLGRAYIATSDDFLSYSCLDLSGLSDEDYDIQPPNTGLLKVESNMSKDSMRETIGGSAEAKLKFKPVVVDGYLKMENDAASDNLTATLNVVYYANAGKFSLKDSGKLKLKLSELGMSVKTNGSYSRKDRTERCGTHYLTGYELTAAFNATLRFSFGTESERATFEGKLKLAAERINAAGELAISDFAGSEHASVSLVVTQLGGDVTRLGGVLSDDITECSATTPTKCLKAMSGIMGYLKTEFPTQFRHKESQSSEGSSELDPKRYWIRNPEMAPITTVDVEFDGIVPSPELLKAYTEARITMNDRFLDELRDKSRIRTIINSGMVKSLAHRNQLIAMQDTLDQRIDAIATAISACYKIEDNLVPCKAARDTLKDRLAAFPIDYSLLVIIPQDFGDYCAQMTSWHRTYFGSDLPANPTAAEQDMVDEVRDTVSAMLNIAPIVQLQGGKRFDHTLPNDTGDVYTPRGTTQGTDGIPLWNCPRIAYKIKHQTSLVSLTDKQLMNIEPLATFVTLKSLDISNNLIQTGIQALGKMKFLEILSAKNSGIEALKGIRNNSLVTIDLTGNKITAEQLEFLASQAGLERLVLNGNKIRSLEGLTDLPALTQLWVRDNPINKNAMRSFLETGYQGLGSAPSIYWDSAACEQLKAEGDVPNIDMLECP